MGSEKAEMWGSSIDLGPPSAAVMAWLIPMDRVRAGVWVELNLMEMCYAASSAHWSQWGPHWAPLMAETRSMGLQRAEMSVVRTNLESLMDESLENW